MTQQSGKLITRTPDKPQYLTKLPGAPEGEYVLFGYNSRFERFDPAVEQLILTLEKDGQWRAVVYARLTAGAPSMPQDSRTEAPASVGPARARFVISVPDKKVWSWYLPNTPANQEEYHWTVKVTNGGKSYSLGFSLYKRAGQKPASGTLAELLNAGQVNLWSSTEDGASVIEGDVRIRAEGNSVVVMINDRKLLAQLFSTRPAVVAFESGLPGETNVTTRIVAVTYEGASATAAERSTPDSELIQGAWKGVSAKVQGQQLPELVFKTVGPTITFAGNKVNWKADPSPEGKKLFSGALANFSLDGVFHLDPTKSPKTIDLTLLGQNPKTPLGTRAPRALLGIYKLEGDSLELCIAIDPEHAEERPSKFESIPGKAIIHVKLKRVPAGTPAKKAGEGRTLKGTQEKR